MTNRLYTTAPYILRRLRWAHSALVSSMAFLVLESCCTFLLPGDPPILPKNGKMLDTIMIPQQYWQLLSLFGWLWGGVEVVKPISDVILFFYTFWDTPAWMSYTHLSCHHRQRNSNSSVISVRKLSHRRFIIFWTLQNEKKTDITFLSPNLLYFFFHSSHDQQ